MTCVQEAGEWEIAKTEKVEENVKRTRERAECREGGRETRKSWNSWRPKEQEREHKCMCYENAWSSERRK